MGNFDTFQRTKNSFFHHQDQYGNEKTLYSLLLTEAYNLMGVCMDYFTASYDYNDNTVWGEDGNRKFVRKFSFMGYMELPLEQDNWTPFGVEPFDSIKVYISKRHFAAASKYDAYDHRQPELTSYSEPRVGDFVKSNYADYFYEIVDVKHQEEMFLQTKHAWELTIRPFKDEHLTFSASDYSFQTSASVSDILAKSGQEDSFNLSATIDQKVESDDVLYDKLTNETDRNKDKYGWW